MRKLISANFSRLFQSTVFWVMEGVCGVIGAFFYIMAIINTRNIGIDWYVMSGTYYFFLEMIYIGLVIAVFSGCYIGTEYSDGTIRNKLSVGHSRKAIFLANLLVVFVAGLIFILTHIFSSLCVGLPFLGGLIWSALAPIGWRIIIAVVVILCYATIFTFLAMSDESKSRNLIVSFILAIIIVLVGLYTSGRLHEPEMIIQMVMQKDGSFLRQEIENPNFLEGIERQIFTVLNALLPSSQALNICRSEGQFSFLSFVCLLGVSGSFTVAGISIIKKKDIK